jgi:hypothetical protein
MTGFEQIRKGIQILLKKDFKTFESKRKKKTSFPFLPSWLSACWPSLPPTLSLL